ncbi:Stress responsive A/B Barrel Domain protein [Planctomycetes bacterium Pan216]|uniref:Stress responsive A/B Barrel Domain protein n=1 Tax=Kolteria novifilia TaxID=2527975 RepID=A0A518B3S4_9BACT|nr:Stress responsive A/B Barrel Domain protein [Planctomycetes bacterium Pan216]
MNARTTTLGMLGAGLILALGLSLRTPETLQAKENEEPMIAHNVYFSLKDKSPEKRQALIDACHRYLAKHPGTVFYAAGPLAEDLDRPVNDRNFDVGLHVIFKDQASHDKYQDAPMHLKFIEEQKDNWDNVRVFDSAVEYAPSSN